jgi:hypothetical protein
MSAESLAITSPKVARIDPATQPIFTAAIPT